jgi:hypothetical protein
MASANVKDQQVARLLLARNSTIEPLDFHEPDLSDDSDNELTVECSAVSEPTTDSTTSIDAREQTTTTATAMADRCTTETGAQTMLEDERATAAPMPPDDPNPTTVGNRAHTTSSTDDTQWAGSTTGSSFATTASATTSTVGSTTSMSNLQSTEFWDRACSAVPSQATTQPSVASVSSVGTSVSQTLHHTELPFISVAIQPSTTTEPQIASMTVPLSTPTEPRTIMHQQQQQQPTEAPNNAHQNSTTAQQHEQQQSSPKRCTTKQLKQDFIQMSRARKRPAPTDENIDDPPSSDTVSEPSSKRPKPPKPSRRQTARQQSTTATERATVRHAIDRYDRAALIRRNPNKKPSLYRQYQDIVARSRRTVE